jgi:hypothetical protein
MADAETPKKRGRPPTRDSANGQTSEPTVTPESNDIAEGKSSDAGDILMTWAEFDKKLYKWEFDNQNLRITRIFFDGEDAPLHYTGCFSECDLSHGKPAIRLSSGEVVEI